MIVVDASVLATALIDDDADGDTIRARLRGEELAAPEIVDLEVLSVVRRLVAAGDLPERRATLAIEDLGDLAVERVPHHPLINRCWQLRENFTPYDAAYVAVAELFQATLVTADGRLARAPGIACEVELINSS